MRGQLWWFSSDRIAQSPASHDLSWQSAFYTWRSVTAAKNKNTWYISGTKRREERTLTEIDWKSASRNNWRVKRFWTLPKLSAHCQVKVDNDEEEADDTEMVLTVKPEGNFWKITMSVTSLSILIHTAAITPTTIKGHTKFHLRMNAS